jgi:hypothetical protein
MRPASPRPFGVPPLMSRTPRARRAPSARLLIAGVCALIVCASALLTASAFGASAKEVKQAESAGLAYMKTQQQSNGSLPGDPGNTNPGFGGEWALTSLAAAHVAAANFEISESATDARTYYRGLIGDTATWPGSEPLVEDFETAALAAYAAGIDPARVSPSQNLIAQIVARYQPGSPGYYGEPELFNATVFGLMALADAKTRAGKQRAPQVLLEQSVAVVRHNQHTDGGWSFLKAEGDKEELDAPAEVELTGAAIAALCGAGVSASDPAIVAAKNYLVTQLDAEPLGSGAFETGFGPNTDSNAWAIEGLDACGISAQSAEFTTAKSKTPVDFVISQQLAGGGFRYAPAETTANFYSSQDAVRALAGAGFTAKPPTPKEAPRWVYETQFSTSKTTPALLALVINNGKAPLAACAVTITPEATKTTLANVLQAAESAAAPAGCVTGFTPATGSGAITSIDGAPSPPAADWKVSIDGGLEKQAKRNTTIEIGDTSYLRLG